MKTQPASRKIYHGGGTRQNVPYVRESKNLDPHENKFVPTKAQGKICPKRMSRKNSTPMNRNLS
ncbi:hypothetical protein BHE74_00054522 [Ensete ventricosum]|nr:hypothetical protein BHE74_00054522 [Ensete ventricosum]